MMNGKIIDIDGENYYFDGRDIRIYKQTSSNFDYNIISENTNGMKKIDFNRCNRLVIIITNACNLSCSYCFYHYQLSRAVKYCDIDSIYEIFIELCKKFKDGIENIQFFGGEPLIRFDIIKEIVRKINIYCVENNIKKPDYGIVTNGTMITDNIIDFCYKNHIYMTISIDGKEKNNTLRRSKSGSPIFSKLETIIKHIKTRYSDYPLTAELTFSRININEFKCSNIHDVEILHRLGFNNVHMQPIASKDENLDPFGKLCVQKDLYKYITKAYDYSIKSMATASPITISDYYVLIDKIRHRTEFDIFCTAGINSFALDCDGQLYSCYVDMNTNSKIELTDLRRKQDEFYENGRKAKQDLCKECWCMQLCSRCAIYSINENYCSFQRYKFEYILKTILKNEKNEK